MWRECLSKKHSAMIDRTSAVLINASGGPDGRRNFPPQTLLALTYLSRQAVSLSDPDSLPTWTRQRYNSKDHIFFLLLLSCTSLGHRRFEWPWRASVTQFLLSRYHPFHWLLIYDCLPKELSWEDIVIADDALLTLKIGISTNVL